MSEHFIVAVDETRLRIYTEVPGFGCQPVQMRLVRTATFGAELGPYTDRAIRLSRGFGLRGERPATPPPARASGRHGELRRQAQEVAAYLNAFWREHPHASWDLAASPALYRVIVEELAPDVQRGLKRVYSSQLLTHGAEAATGDLASA